MAAVLLAPPTVPTETLPAVTWLPLWTLIVPDELAGDVVVIRIVEARLAVAPLVPVIVPPKPLPPSPVDPPTFRLEPTPFTFMLLAPLSPRSSANVEKFPPVSTLINDEPGELKMKLLVKCAPFSTTIMWPLDQFMVALLATWAVPPS